MLLVRCQIKDWCCQSAHNTVTSKGMQRNWLMPLKQKKRLHIVYDLVNIGEHCPEW